MKVKIMCGVSGSGKSTYIQNHFPDALVCSADHFFMDAAGNYNFDPSLLSEAHAACLRKFSACVISHYDMPDGVGTLIVDNTNTTTAELAPYAALALAYGHDLEIIMIEADPEKAYRRNRHRVPDRVVADQDRRLKKLGEELPRWWTLRRVAMEG